MVPAVITSVIVAFISVVFCIFYLLRLRLHSCSTSFRQEEAEEVEMSRVSVVTGSEDDNLAPPVTNSYNDGLLEGGKDGN